jgi:hypothetical protein
MHGDAWKFHLIDISFVLIFNLQNPIDIWPQFRNWIAWNCVREFRANSLCFHVNIPAFSGWACQRNKLPPSRQAPLQHLSIHQPAFRRRFKTNLCWTQTTDRKSKTAPIHRCRIRIMRLQWILQRLTTPKFLRVMASIQVSINLLIWLHEHKVNCCV